MQYFAEDFAPQEYDSLTDLSGNKNVTLMCHNETKKLIVRKTITGVNKELYKQLVRLRHENLVQVMGLQEADGHCYTYEEHINGETLANILANGPIPEEDVVCWIRQLCKAVKLLHEQSRPIIHRDIKPSNIMLLSGLIKLIDFDASKEFLPDKQRDTKLIGTPNYAAPEQYGFAASDPRTDIYAIGILFHELLTGYKPNEINCPYRGRYKKIIQKCIELDPKMRYQSVQELERQLGVHGLRDFIRYIPGFHTGILWKKVVAAGIYIVMAVSITGAFLYQYQILKEIEPEIKDRQRSPEVTDKVTAEENMVEDTQAEDESVSPKSAHGEDWLQVVQPSLPIENKQLQEKVLETQQSAKGKLIIPRKSIPWNEVDVTTYFAGLELKGSNSFDVAFADWKTWRKGEAGYIYFPRGTEIDITVENNSRQDLINPILKIVFFFGHMDDDVTLGIEDFIREANNAFYSRKDRITAGGNMKYRLPLERICVNASTMEQTGVGIDFRADNFSGQNGVIMNFKLIDK